MAKVPDLGSDFAQKLLRDLRRRRERLGFDSSATPAKGSAAAPRARDAHSNAQKPPQVQKQQQAASRVATRSGAATSLSRRQGNSSSIARPGTPRRHDAPAVAHSHAIVPFQGGGGGGKQTAPAASAGGVDVQMALALALSNSGKLHNVHLAGRQGAGGGSVFFGKPGRTGTAAQAYHHLLAPGAHVGKVAIGVQKLNDILVAYSSGGAAGARRRGTVEIGKQLLRGAMDLEESLSMLMMLQDASDYMEMGSSGNGGGKVLLLEGKESWKSSAPRSTSSAASARLVEIFDDDSEETEQAGDAKSPSDAFLQIVPHGMSSRSYRPNHISPSRLAGAATANNRKSSATSGEKDDSKVRMPSLIAKLMGLENLPSAKTAAARKGTERFVKPEAAVPRKSTATNAMAGTLPIRIIASERMAYREQIKNFQTREWNISLTKPEEPVLSSIFSDLTVDKKTGQTMRQMLSKQEGTERRVCVNQVIDEKIVRQDTKLTEDSSQQKTIVSAGRKKNFLRRLRKNGKDKPATEERVIVEENKQKLGKKTTSTKQRDGEVKPRKTREKFNKENLANPGNKAQGKNGKATKTDQIRRQGQSKPSDKQIMEKKVQNYRRMQSETAIQNLERKRSLKSEPSHTNTKEKLESVTLTELQNGEGTKIDGTRSFKPSDNTPGDDSVCEQSAVEMEDSSTTREALTYQSEKELTEEINGPTTVVAQTATDSTAETNDDKANRTVSETIQTLETFSEGEQLQQQLPQMKEVNDQSTSGLDHHLMKPSNPYDLRTRKMNVVSCDSFTENQLLLAEMLLKDPYLLETAKAITGFRVPVSVVQINTGKWLDKGNKVLSDIGREVIRKKGKRTEAMTDVSVTRAANLKLQTLDDLIRELDSDIQSLHVPRKIQQQSGLSTAENLKMVLRSDMESTHSDANSVWDFGWNRVWDLPIEKNEVVRDLEKNILGSIITDVTRELIDVSIRHGCCACES